MRAQCDITYDPGIFESPTVSLGPSARATGKSVSGSVAGSGSYQVIVSGGSSALPSGTLAYVTFTIEKIAAKLDRLRKEKNVPFIATDRSVLNLPGVGKSLTYRTIGITDDGRRILEFEYDTTRNHSPITNTMGNVVIIESKSIANYLRQMESVGEDVDEYKTIWGYSASETESRMPLYQYPEYDFQTTSELTNFLLDAAQLPGED